MGVGRVSIQTLSSLWAGNQRDFSHHKGRSTPAPFRTALRFFFGGEATRLRPRGGSIHTFAACARVRQARAFLQVIIFAIVFLHRGLERPKLGEFPLYSICFWVGLPHRFPFGVADCLGVSTHDPRVGSCVLKIFFFFSFLPFGATTTFRSTSILQLLAACCALSRPSFLLIRRVKRPEESPDMRVQIRDPPKLCVI